MHGIFHEYRVEKNEIYYEANIKHFFLTFAKNVDVKYSLLSIKEKSILFCE